MNPTAAELGTVACGQKTKDVVAKYLLSLLERMEETKDAWMLETGENCSLLTQQLCHHLPAPRLV